MEGILEKILDGESITGVETTSYGDFEFRYPLVKDEILIEKTIASYLNGVPATSFDPETLKYFRAIATLKTLVVKGPSWYKGVESLDETAFAEIYGRLLQFREKLKSDSRKPGSFGTPT